MDHKAKNADVVIAIGAVTDEGLQGFEGYQKVLKPIEYNVSAFLRHFNNMEPKWHRSLEQFIYNLDDYVKIDINSPLHKPVLNGIDVLANKVCEELKKKDTHFTQMRILHSGSLYTGLRVGRPYEADILFEIDQRSADLRERQRPRYFGAKPLKRVSDMMVDILLNVVIPGWIVQAITEHNAGLCVMLEHRTTDNKSMGVCVDLIPVVRLEDRIPSHRISYAALRYIRDTDEDLDYTIFHLYHHRKGEDFYIPHYEDVDTGYLEHQILKNLPKSIKVPYRIVKYLLQSQLTMPAVCGDVDDISDVNDDIDDEHIFVKYKAATYTKSKALQLFGYKPLIRSHFLKILLLQFVIKTHGTAIENNISTAALTCCLFDMLLKTVKEISGLDAAFYTIIDSESGDDEINDADIIDDCDVSSEHQDYEYGIISYNTILVHPLLKDKQQVVKITPRKHNGRTIYNWMNHSVEPALVVLCCSIFKHISIDATSAINRYRLHNTRIHPIINRILNYILSQNETDLQANALVAQINMIMKEQHPKAHALTFAAFSQGPTVHEMASCHDCETEGCQLIENIHHFAKALKALLIKI